MQPVYGELAKWRNVGEKEGDDVVAAYEREYGRDKVLSLPKTLGRWHPGSSTRTLEPLLRDYLNKDYVLPPWVADSADAVERAQHRSVRNAGISKVVLATYSLPVVYLHPEIAITLMGTGQLIQHVERRLLDTQQFIDTVSAEGALVERGRSWQWLRKVRLSHSVIRRVDQLTSPVKSNVRGNISKTFAHGNASYVDSLSVRHHPRNKTIAKGVPIDQLQLSYVLLSFSWVIVDGSARLGHPMSYREADDHIRLWAVVGHMLGLVDDLIPGGRTRPTSDAKKMFDAFQKALIPRRNQPDPPGVMEGRQLVAVLLSALADRQRPALPSLWSRWDERLPWLDAAIQSLPRTLLRELCGPAAAATLHVGRTPLAYWLLNQVMLKNLDRRHWNRYLPKESSRTGHASGHR